MYGSTLQPLKPHQPGLSLLLKYHLSYLGLFLGFQLCSMPDLSFLVTRTTLKLCISHSLFKITSIPGTVCDNNTCCRVELNCPSVRGFYSCPFIFQCDFQNHILITLLKYCVRILTGNIYYMFKFTLAGRSFH